MAKLNQTQVAIVKAVEAYKAGSSGIVRAFEQTVHGFWHVDSCNPMNVQFMLNALKRFPVIQRTAVALLTKKGDKALAYFDIKKDKEGQFTVKNQEGITKEMKVIARRNIAKFIAMEYTSLSHDKDVKVEIKFDADKGANSIRNAIFAQVKAMLAVNGDVDEAIINNMIIKATADALSSEARTKAAAEAQKLKDKAAKADESKLANVA